MKVLLIIIGILILITIAVASFGYYWWSQHGEQFIADTQEIMNKAGEFAKEADSFACLDKVNEMIVNCESIECTLHNRFFLSECLAIAKYDVDFCQNIPPASDFIQAADWKQQHCIKINKNDTYCEGVIDEVIIFCDTKRDLL
ncbi:hypothetical protein H0A36_21210 [Endozoicomonas sp. SM1973]|uniref:Uncharacterized protein n=1 Tax=Spartinivicinus marinus TaxID=2994442 RepID=A0A853IGD0_9GAMM|nr:hypothetical protein [Spartinivicinus marinus]MCX4027733.1 hypothetical protein [Spartinivicinus marinus]NYZ68537.1 hypothetical protein [Spartinivicinus marinus]